MSYSMYVNQLNKDVGDMWYEALGSYSEVSYKRAFSDDVEREFWKEHSQVYDLRPSLYTYAPEVFDDIVAIIGRDKTVLELGAGTGQFTLPMSKIQTSILAVDYSRDMLNKLEEKILKPSRIRTLHSKIEDLKDIEAEVVFGVNCIYRIQDIEVCLRNLMKIKAETYLFVWTMQRSMYDALLNAGPKKGILRKQEYIHLVNILYNMGIDCNLKTKKVYKQIDIEDIEFHYGELKSIAQHYELDFQALKHQFDQNIFKEKDNLVYKCEQTIAFISF